MKTILLAVLSTLALASCVSTSNLYHSGKTLGKDSSNVTGSITLSQMPSYVEPDSAAARVAISKNRVPLPWAQLQLAKGVGKKLDVGGGFGVGIYSGGVHFFAKYALLKPESKTGLSLFTQVGGALAGVSADDNNDDNGTEEVINTNITHLNSLHAIPMSFQLSRRTTFVLQPMYSVERMRVSIKDSSTGAKFKTVKVEPSYRLGTGLIFENKRAIKVHYNVAVGYYPESKTFAPTLGIGFSAK